VIVGVGVTPKAEKWLFEYPDSSVDPIEQLVENINPYLLPASTVIIQARGRPVSDSAPNMLVGGKPVDGGHLLLNEDEKALLIETEPGVEAWIRPFTMGVEFINGISRWCLWLIGISPAELRSMPAVLKRVEAVRQMRLESPKLATRNLAATSTLFGEIRTSNSNYLAVPRVSSERRLYVPIGYLDASVVSADMVCIVPNATLFEFGVITSAMHMGWVRTTCGRLKSDYRYSNTVVYNNFPWPEGVIDAQTVEIERLAQAVLDARDEFPGSTLADLYDPLTMPPVLAHAHHALDRAVDRLYRKAPFPADSDRVALLFERYQALVG
jgi:hypothetical protein